MDLEFPTLETPAAPPQELAPVAKATLDLARVDLTDVALAQFGDWRKDVAETTKKLTGLVLDLSTQAKIDEAKSLRHRLINVPLAEARKVSKALKSKLTSVSAEVGKELEKIEADYTMAGQLITPKIEAREAEIAEEKRIAAEKESARRAAHEAGIATCGCCAGAEARARPHQDPHSHRGRRACRLRSPGPCSHPEPRDHQGAPGLHRDCRVPGQPWLRRSARQGLDALSGIRLACYLRCHLRERAGG